MYKNLFFDFDGTLFNGYPRMLHAFKKMLKERRNIEVTYDDLFKDVMISFRYLYNKYNITREERDYYDSLCKNDDSLPPYQAFDGTEDLLKELTSKGVRCFIYTNRNETTIDFMKQLDLDKYITDYIIDAEKPSVGPLDNMIDKHHLIKRECLVVGDRTLDIESAVASKIDSFSINSYKAEPLATFQGQGFSELLKIVFLSKIKGVVFDMDGVLVSTDELHYLAWKHIAEDEGIYFDKHINDELRGISRKSSLEVILRKRTREYSANEKQELLDRKGVYYKEILDKLDQSFVPKVTLDCLHEMQKNGIKIAIGSSSLNGLYISTRLDFAKEFEAIVDGTMITKPKPDPEVFLKSCYALGLKPEECLIVEDATAGIEAGNRGGFISVGMSYAALYNKTNVRINDLSELMGVINKINSIAK